MRTVTRNIRKSLLASGRYIRSVGKRKIFCIGQNKTGTTSVAYALAELGVPVAPTLHDHDPLMWRIIRDWSQGDFRSTVKLCHTARAFQDYPFSLPNTFVELDNAFPDSQFILTVRDSAQQWCESFTRYYLNKYWNGEHPLAKHAAPKHRYADHALYRMRMIYGNWDDPFEEQRLMNAYDTQNRSVLDYFAQRSSDLLVVNVATDQDYLRLCKFLGKQPMTTSFPWLNKTSS